MFQLRKAYLVIQQEKKKSHKAKSYRQKLISPSLVFLSA